MSTMIDLLQICDAKTEFPRRCNVSWLAKEQIFGRVVIKIIVVCGDAVRIVLPHGRRTPFAALLFNRLQVQWCP